MKQVCSFTQQTQKKRKGKKGNYYIIKNHENKNINNRKNDKLVNSPPNRDQTRLIFEI